MRFLWARFEVQFIGKAAAAVLPIRDENPIRIVPVLTIGLIGVCVLVFVWQLAGDAQAQQVKIYRFGLIPASLTGAADLPPGLAVVPSWTTLFTSMFMHGGFLHLGGNMLFLWIFGNNIEDRLGHGRFMLFYLLSGLGAAAAQVLLDPASMIPMVGASGAISGVMGAYMVLYPRAQVVTLVFLGFLVTTMRIRAIWYLGIWGLMQLLSTFMMQPGEGGVAFAAHVGGFVAGIALILVMSPPRRRRRGPWG